MQKKKKKTIIEHLLCGIKTVSKINIVPAAMVWMCSSKICMLNLITNMMVVESGAFGKWLGREGRFLVNGIVTLIKEAPENCLVPSTVWGHKYKAPSMN